ncbi:terminase family protein [Algiphilus sp.]|uniref:terminase large subunit domain-containing protein n=1 Tax=Algiphilus sp. TaxID=1872431 RepID=UPI0025C50CE2|nr:terminase family protein [Algiphilus sp.]MCK5772004.1 terminase family protein [Algiphilus sp.]
MSEPIIRLHDRQKAWVDDHSRFKAGMMARQTGKTWGSTLEIVDDCLDAEVNGGKRRWVILSRGERQAREAMEEGIKAHFQLYGATFDALEVQWDGCEDKALEVKLPNGSRITGLPSNPDTARGFTANVLLDEFAFHADSRKIWGALFPVISRKDLLLRVISTPNGKSNKFYELLTQGGVEDELRATGHATAGRWSLHLCNIHDAIAGGLDRDADDLREGLGDDDLWRQEYLLEWLDEASAWLDYDLINAVEHDKAGDPDHYTGGPCYVGNDIGRRKDLWVVWVDELIGDVFWTREVIAKQRISFREQDQLLDEVMRRYRVMRLCMDQTGMGEKPVEDAQRRYGEYVVEGVQFTGPNKLMLATNGKQVFEDRKTRIPLGDQLIRADLHSLRKLVTPTGAPRFDADGDTDGHADRAWAKFLALYAGSSPYQPFRYEPVRVGRRREDDDEDDDRIATTAGFNRYRGVI